MGIPVPSKYVYWAELLLIQMVSLSIQTTNIRPSCADKSRVIYYK